MNILTNDFYIAAGKAAKNKSKVKVKQPEEFKYFSFELGNTRQDLKKELAKAEELYQKLEQKIGKEKLTKIANKIQKLKAKLEEKTDSEPGFDDPIEHEGMEITPPMTEDLKEQLDSTDIHYEEETSKDTTGKEQREEPKTKANLLNLAPPPPKQD